LSRFKPQLKQELALWQVLLAAKAALEKKNIELECYSLGGQWLGGSIYGKKKIELFK
jgi:hypothetical protein